MNFGVSSSGFVTLAERTRVHLQGLVCSIAECAYVAQVA